ncbi:Aldehyde oxidase 2 [Vulpes lagopus]
MPCPSKSDDLVFFVNGRKVIERNVDPEVTLLTFLRKNWILLIKIWAVSMFALKLKPVMMMKTNLTSPSPASSTGPYSLCFWQ